MCWGEAAHTRGTLCGRSKVVYADLEDYRWLNQWMNVHLYTTVRLIDCLRILSCICPSLPALSSSSCHGNQAPSLNCHAPWLPAPLASRVRDNLGLSCSNRSFDWPQWHKQLEDVCLDLQRKLHPRVSRLQSDKWWDYYMMCIGSIAGKIYVCTACEWSRSPHCVTVR